jgi:hypothetical protein
VLVVPEVFLLWLFDSSFEYHQLIFDATMQWKIFFFFFLTIDWKKILIGKKIITVVVFCIQAFQVKVYKFCKNANKYKVFHLECINKNSFS